MFIPERSDAVKCLSWCLEVHESMQVAVEHRQLKVQKLVPHGDRRVMCVPRSVYQTIHADYDPTGHACVRTIVDGPVLVGSAQKQGSTHGKLPSILDEKIGKPTLSRAIHRDPWLGSIAGRSAPSCYGIWILHEKIYQLFLGRPSDR